MPMAVYRDRHSIFESVKNALESLEEQLEGKRRPTQFGRLMAELGITSIPSNSPQGRGHIERLWGTFQDRLRSELRLAGAKTLEEANRVLWDFLPRYNRKFAVAPAEPGSAYRQPGKDFDADRVFCFKYYRTVGLDNVVRLGGHRLQIMPGNGRLSYARARVEVHERMDGSLAVYYEGHCLATNQAPAEAPVLRLTRQVGNQTPATGSPRPPVQVVPAPAALSPSAMGRRPAPDHPWRNKLVTFVDTGSRG